MHGAAIPHQTLVVVTDVIPCDPQHSFERSHHSPHFADRTREAHITTDSTFSVKVAGRRVKCWDAPWSLMGVCPAALPKPHPSVWGHILHLGAGKARALWAVVGTGPPASLWLGSLAILTLLEHLLCAKCFTLIMSFNPQNSHMGEGLLLTSELITDKKTEV